MTFAPAKFEVATSNSLAEDAFTRKYMKVKVTQNVAQCPLHHVTYAPTEFEVTTLKALGGEPLQENSIFYLDLGVKVTQNVAQYPLHHVTYPATKFEVARSNRLGGDTFTRKYII